MAFTDPQTITINAIAIPAPRQFTGSELGKFTSADGKTVLTIDPRSTAKRNRRTVRLNQEKVTADPLIATTNVRVGDMISFTIDRPKEGYSDAEVLLQASGLISWLTASSNANLIKLIAGEN